MLTIYRGDTPTISVNVTDDNGVFDLTGWAAKLTGKGNINLPAKILEKVITDIPNPELGIIVFELSATDTDMPIGEHYYDIEISKDDKVHTINCDKIKVLQDVTN